MEKKLWVSTAILGMLLLTACGKTTSTKTEDAKETSSSVEKSSSRKKSSVKIVNKDNSSSSQSTKQRSRSSASSESQSDSSEVTKQQLVGKNYTLEPVEYDGEDANKAMDDGKAPANLVHDGILQYHFTNDSTVSVKHLGAYNPSSDYSYTFTDGHLNIDDKTIPYTISDGKISFEQFTTSPTGHMITWKLVGDDTTTQQSATNSWMSKT